MKPSAKIGIREAYAYRHEPECTRMLADFYWRILMSVALAILFLSLVYGVIKLSAVIEENDKIFAQSINTTQPAPKLNKTQLQDTLTAFREREDRFNALKSGAQKIPDPSR